MAVSSPYRSRIYSTYITVPRPASNTLTQHDPPPESVRRIDGTYTTFSIATISYSPSVSPKVARMRSPALRPMKRRLMGAR